MSQALSPAQISVKSPNVVSLRDLITQRQQRGTRFRLAEVVAIVVPICTDLRERHARGEQVFVYASAIGADPDGTPRLMAQVAKNRPTDPRDVIAMAPELSSSPPTARSSVFGLGALVYELLTLAPIAQGMKPPSQIVQGLPTIVDTILAKALLTDPAHRPDDLAAFAQAIHHFSPASIAPPPPADETAFEVDLDLRSSMLPPPSLDAHLPRIPKDNVRISAPQDPYAAIDSRPSAPISQRNSQSRTAEELNALKSRLEADPAPRWMVVKDKMDHGPFAAIELLQQIVSNTFKPTDLLVDTHTNKRIPIADHPEFSRFAHHAELKREQVKEAKAVVALERAEKTGGAVKGTLGILALLALVAMVGLVVWRIKGKADEEARRKQSEEAQSIDGEGSIAAKAREKARRTGGAPGALAAGGKGYDEAMKSTVSDFEADTLSSKECAAPVGGNIAAGCGLNGSARAQILVKAGKAVGVTVTTDPSQPGVNSCMSSTIRGLSWRSVPGATGCIRTFKSN
ncbi:MAG: hypothetical protein NVSMB1_05580 [Polyangiales bacterium]